MRLKLEHMLAPFAAALILALIGAIAVWTHHPWFVPSLGAAAFLQTMTPDVPSAKPWNIVMGQLIGLGAGFAGVYALGVAAAAPFDGGHPLIWPRVGAVGVSIALVALLGEIARLTILASRPAGRPAQPANPPAAAPPLPRPAPPRPAPRPAAVVPRRLPRTRQHVAAPA